MEINTHYLSKFLFLLLAILTAANSVDRSIPVVYVSFGELPLYLRLNIELAARKNDVIVLSDVENVERFHWPSNGISSNNASSSSSRQQPHNILFESLIPFTNSAKRFAPLYRHLSKDHSDNRIKHELRCFQRWFILQDYMQRRNISRAYFSDGDSSVFTNVTDVVKNTRANCSAVINIEAQFHDLHWVGAGEASVWTLPAIVDFCAFVQVTNALLLFPSLLSLTSVVYLNTPSELAPTLPPFLPSSLSLTIGPEHAPSLSMPMRRVCTKINSRLFVSNSSRGAVW